MAALKRGTLFLPRCMQVRSRGKINIQHPKPRHDARRLFEAITQPVVRPEIISPVEKCNRKYQELLLQVEEVNPYEEFLLKQCKKMLAKHRMIAVCQTLPMSQPTLKGYKNLLLNNGFTLQFFNNRLMRRAVDETPLTNLQPFLVGRNMYIVSEEPKVATLIKTLRKIPEMILLGGLVQNYILTKEGMVQYSKLPPLDIMRGQVVATLSAGASRTRSLLSSHQQMLSVNLEQYVKQSQDSQGESSSSPSSADVSSDKS